MKQVKYIGTSHVRVLSEEDMLNAWGVTLADGINFNTRGPEGKDGITVSNALADKLVESGEWEVMYEHSSETSSTSSTSSSGSAEADAKGKAKATKS